MTTIEEIFEKNKIDFKQVDISNNLFLMSLTLSEKVTEYLQCMGKTIKLHETKYGSIWVTLYNAKDLIDNQYPVCNEKNLLIIGHLLNGDLLTINLKNEHIGYVFHDDLWEENYSSIEDIYCELLLDIEIFLKIILEDKIYPID